MLIILKHVDILCGLSVNSKSLKTKNDKKCYYQNVLHLAVKNQDLRKNKKQKDD